MDGKITWVPVDISEGMFSNEYAVSLKNDEGFSSYLIKKKEVEPLNLIVSNKIINII